MKKETLSGPVQPYIRALWVYHHGNHRGCAGLETGIFINRACVDACAVSAAPFHVIRPQCRRSWHFRQYLFSLIAARPPVMDAVYRVRPDWLTGFSCLGMVHPVPCLSLSLSPSLSPHFPLFLPLAFSPHTL